MVVDVSMYIIKGYLHIIYFLFVQFPGHSKMTSFVKSGKYILYKKNIFKNKNYIKILQFYNMTVMEHKAIFKWLRCKNKYNDK